MADVKRLLPVGGESGVANKGRSIRVASADGPLLIKTSDEEYQVSQGGVLDFGAKGFDRFVVVNLHDAEQRIRLDVGDAVITSNQLSGSVNVESAPPVQFDGPQPVVVQNAPEVPQGASHYHSFLNSGALQTIVAPASNVNGIKVHMVALGSDVICRLMSKTSAPTAYSDTGARTLMYVRDNGYCIDKPFYIPAGEGLYLFPVTSGFHGISLFYEVL